VRIILCPQCSTPLPWTAQYCANCGRPVSSQVNSLSAAGETVSKKNYSKYQHPGSLKTPSFYQIGQSDPDETQRIDRSQSQVGALNAPLAAAPAIDNNSNGHIFVEDWPEETEAEEIVSEDEMQRRATWQKVVTRKSPYVSVQDLPSTPAPTDTPPHVPATPLTPIFPITNGTPIRRVARVPRTAFMPPPANNNRHPRTSFMPRMTGWITALVIVALLLGGAFGVYVSLGRNPSPTNNVMSLQATPYSIAQGDRVTLRGSHFSPRVRVGLTRDATIPIVDTSGASYITTDANGSFSDSVSIDASWTAGPHTIRAEDARLHKTASTTIIVTGISSSLRPAHFALSTSSVDFGSGDQASDSTQTITLLNAGGEEITWQSTATQPWLLLSPASGTVAGEQSMQITLGCDRSNLQVGSYTAAVIFTSNAGQIRLTVKMQVTQLQPGHQAVLQVTPVVLSFSGVDGSASPASQVATVSNPGVAPLQWSATSATNDGSNWLNVSPQSGTVTKGNSQPVTIAVNSSQLLPGVYYGSVTFSSQGSQPVVNGSQTIYVSVTIVPQCAIQVSPGALTFTSAYLQAGPNAQAISVAANQGCSAPLNWAASATTSSGAQWLSISASSGTTPATPKVSINVTGLTPGNYSGSLVLSSAAGNQTLPVTLIIGQPTTPIMASAPALFNTNGVIGQAPAAQTITLTNSGGGTLAWNAAAVTSAGGAWLAATPASGTLNSHQSANITVTFTPLQTLIPGAYNGSITITGTDGYGHAAAGSPQTLPVTFTVQAPCSIATSLPALTFQSVSGQPAPAAQQITVRASGACGNTLNWTAIPAGGSWLTATPAGGTVGINASSLTMVGIANAGLAAGSYTGSVAISATDSVTNKPVGKPQVVTVNLTVQSPCTLQAPSVAARNFTVEAGQNPHTKSFTIGIIGSCSGNVTITPTVTMASGSGWLAVTPASATIATNRATTFTISVTSAALAAGKYTGTISLAGVDSTGMAISGSPRMETVNLNVVSAPALTAGPAALTFNVTTGIYSQTITIKNTGGEPLNWSAALAANAPSYVSISSASSGKLAAGASTTVTISVNATGLAGGTTVSTSVTVSATDPLTGSAVSGSPATVPISIHIAAPPPPPAMQLSATTLAFTTTVGANPTPQPITITNTGGGTLTWTAGAPVYSPSTSSSWLTVSPTTGRDAAGSTSTPSFNVTVGALTAGTYTATVDFTAPGGISQTVTVTLSIS